MGSLGIRMIRISNQRSERKKWIHQFENITNIIYMVDLCSYDEVLLDGDNKQNRMAEKMVLFNSVVESRWIMRTSIILFFTNLNQFKQKLVRAPMKDYFPDYNGGNDFNRAAKYLLWRFNQMNRAHLDILPHLVELTDASIARLVLSDIKETVLQQALKPS